jgi:hypothetical protein
MNIKNILIIGGVVIIGITLYFFFKPNPPLKEPEVPEIEEPQVFEPSLLAWEKAIKAMPWPARDSHTVVVFQDKLWLIGGLNGNNHLMSPGAVDYEQAPHFSDIWMSEDGIQWTLITNNAPWKKRRSIQSVVFQDKLWLIPGWGPETGVTSEIWNSQDGIDWQKVSTNGVWPSREGHQLVVFQDKLWLIGGVNYATRETKNDVWYSQDGIDWHQSVSIAPWPSRWDHEVITFNDKLWLIGGMDLIGNTYKDVWASEDGEDWLLITNDPPWAARQGHELVVYQDRIWIIGRFNSFSQGGGLNDVWYSQDGIDWQKTINNPPWQGREDHSAFVFQDRIWVIGGMTSDWVWMNDVWRTIN